MATVTLEHVGKVYDGGVRAVIDLNLDIADREFMVLVGPSGCGKTSALRMIAGLEEITEGIVRIGDRVVNDLEPRERDIAMVFQNYALYPHMTVADNIGFALQLRKLSKAEIKSKVDDAAKVLGLTEHLSRKPAQLSGGQRQRVAMGRAIVRDPSAFLMDEPLSNLDAKLRVQMRAEIARIQRRLGVATIYVTHDQTEAMTLGDRVAVMREGVLQQVSPPQELYDHPANVFVAAFIGSPAMNIYEGSLDADGSRVRLGDQTLDLPAAITGSSALAPFRNKDVIVGIRPEHLSDAATSAPAGDGHGILQGDVEIVEALGSEKLVHFLIDAQRVQTVDAIAVEDGGLEADALAQGELGSSSLNASIARVDPTSGIRPGERATFRVDTSHLQLFDPETTTAITSGPESASTSPQPPSA
ncbi:MAG TPA: sn-glycerol-3-phosphate ABC transporter ATP-binding protein UgpC [Solirubrobacteraceae bacterium]